MINRKSSINPESVMKIEAKENPANPGANAAFLKLFEPGTIGKLVVKNRIIKAPTYSCLATPDGAVTERLIRFYEELARGGVGLIIVEMAWIDRKASQAGPCQLGACDEHISGLSLLAEAIQAHGAKAGLQISHCGRQKFWGIPPMKAPSRVPWEELRLKGGAVPEELTFEEIQEIVEAFGNAAKRAKIAGFDIVEIHGAHGYLITNFLSPRTNKRTDWYGGSLENRMRFLVEVVTNVRSKIGPDFPLSVRLNGSEYETDGIMIEESIEVAKVLEKLGLDVIHVSGGNHHQHHYECSPMGMPTGIHVWASERIKKATHIPVVASGSITTPELAEEILINGKADFVALARALFADPHWARKVKEGRREEIRPCIRCNDGCNDRSNLLWKAIQCTVNVAVGREREFDIIPAKYPRRIVVIGGGPGGMEAARVCALRGHEVTLYEKRKLGGAMIEASIPEFKRDIRQLINYFANQMEKLEIKLINKEIAINDIKKSNFFDVAIVAVGAIMRRLDVPGINKSIVTDYKEVLYGKIDIGRKVIVVGGGYIGTEVALFLAEQGKEVVITTRQDELMYGMSGTTQKVYEERFAHAKNKVIVHTGKRLEAIRDNGAVFSGKFGAQEEVTADKVVLCSGLMPQLDFADQLKNKTKLEVYPIGDCVSPRSIFDAIHDGFLTAWKLG